MTTKRQARCQHYHKTNGRRCSSHVPDGSKYYCWTHGCDDPCRGCGEVLPKTIKVSVTVQITINVADYQAAYGRDDLDTIRRDVKYAVLDAVTSGGVLADGIADADLR